MADEHGRVDKSAAAELLASADQATNAMVSSKAHSRFFLCAYVVIWSTGLSLEHVLPGGTEFWIFALSIPLALVHYFSTRNLAKSRPPLRNSEAYGVYSFLAFICIMCLRLWIAEDLGTVAAKWIITVTLLWHLLSSAQKAWEKDLLEDSREQAV